MNIRTWHGLAVALAMFWLFVRGVTLDATVIVSELLLGTIIGVSTAFVFRRLYPSNVDLPRVARATPYAALYLVAFLWELMTANIDVAHRTLSPAMPLDPSVIELPLRVQTPLAITTIANSISLTPGTLTMDHDDTTNTLYVHAIAGEPEAVVAPIRRWEDYALVIFDEDRKPGDPVPEPDADDDVAMRHETPSDGGDQDGE